MPRRASSQSPQPPGPSGQPSHPPTTLPRLLREQLRAYSQRRDSLRLDTLQVGALNLSELAADLVVKNQSIDLEHFQAKLLGGVIAGSLQFGLLADQGDDTGLSLTGEFAQVNLARLLPGTSGLAPGAGDINGNLRAQLLFPPTAKTPLSLNGLSVTVNITRIGKQALDRLLLFLDPLERSPTIVNQRRLLRLATPRVVTLRLRHGILQMDTELDTLLGRKHQPLSPMPISALEGAGFPQVSTLLAQLQPLSNLLSVITAQTIGFDTDGQLSLD